MNWYKLKYRLPVNEGSKPEIVAYKAETEAEAKQRLFDYYEKNCHGIYGIPVLESIHVYKDWNAVKESVMEGE